MDTDNFDSIEWGNYHIWQSYEDNIDIVIYPQSPSDQVFLYWRVPAGEAERAVRLELGKYYATLNGSMANVIARLAALGYDCTIRKRGNR